MDNALKITLLLPVYNEEKVIAGIIRRCREILGPEAEILVVDDGSSDGTVAEVQKTSAELIRHEHNQGKGAAMRTGIARAKGKILVVMDADGQDDPADIPRLVQALEENDADMVSGSRFLGTLKKGAMSKGNRIGTFGVDFILNSILGIKITDSQAGFRAFKTEKLRALDLQSTWYDVETETVIKAHRMKYKVVEIPVVRDRREFGESQHRKFKFVVRFFKLIFRIYLRKKVRRSS